MTEQWECPYCQKQNDEHLNRCAECGITRPGSGITTFDYHRGFDYSYGPDNGWDGPSEYSDLNIGGKD